MVYYIEGHPLYLPLLDPFFDAIGQRELRAVTSTVTLLEVLVLPLRQGDKRLIERYRSISGLQTIPVSATVAEEAARLRANHRMTTPDALQLATAITTGATAILTNDVRFPRLLSPQLLILDELRGV
jgi:predicted nucleic acid-binding protein